MNKAGIFIGQPINFEDICRIYPPTVNEVITEDKFDTYISLLLITQEDLDDELIGRTDEEGNPIEIPTPFEYLMGHAYVDSNSKDVIAAAFSFFIKEPVFIVPQLQKIIIGDLEQESKKIKSADDFRVIDKENYFTFQNKIREVLGREPIETPEDLSSLHPKIREMKKKARERDRVKAKQDAKNAPTLDILLASICCMGIGLTPLNIGEISYACVSMLINAFQRKEKYDTDVHSIIMGADPKKVKIEYWIGKEKEK